MTKILSMKNAESVNFLTRIDKWEDMQMLTLNAHITSEMMA